MSGTWCSTQWFRDPGSSLLWFCLPLVLGALSIQLVDREKTEPQWEVFRAQSSHHFYSNSIGQKAVTWPLVTTKKPGKCSPAAAQGGKGDGEYWGALSTPDTATVLDASPGLLYTESMLFPLSWFLSLLTTTKSLYGPFSPARLAYSPFLAPDLCLLSPSCCNSSNTRKGDAPGGSSSLPWIRLLVTLRRLPPGDMLSVSPNPRIAGCFWARSAATASVWERGLHGGFQRQEERGLSWSLGWTVSRELGISRKGTVPDDLAAQKCCRPGHLPKVTLVVCPYPINACCLWTPWSWRTKLQEPAGG